MVNPQQLAESSEVAPESKPQPGLFFNPYLQLLLSIVLSAGSQLFLKKGADESVHAAVPFALGFSGLHSGWVWAGIACQIGSLFSWLYGLRSVPLSIAFNLAGLTQVIVPLLSWACLGETIGGVRWLGIGLVFAGVMVVAKPLIKLEEL